MKCGESLKKQRGREGARVEGEKKIREGIGKEAGLLDFKIGAFNNG